MIHMVMIDIGSDDVDYDDVIQSTCQARQQLAVQLIMICFVCFFPYTRAGRMPNALKRRMKQKFQLAQAFAIMSALSDAMRILV